MGALGAKNELRGINVERNSYVMNFGWKRLSINLGSDKGVTRKCKGSIGS